MFLFGHITHPKMTEPSSADFVMSEDKEILVFSQILSLNAEFSDKNICHSVKGLEPAISCIRDQDATTAPARHM